MPARHATARVRPCCSTTRALHASAEAVGDGRVWLLLTSAFEPQGAYPLLQLVGAAALAALLVARAGVRALCCAVLALAWWRCASR